MTLGKCCLHILESAASYVKRQFFLCQAIAKNPLKLSIDLKPALTEEQLDERILRDFAEAKNKQFKNSLNHLYPAKLVPVIIERSGIDPDKQVNEITKEERRRLVETTKTLTFTLTGLGRLKRLLLLRAGRRVKGINLLLWKRKRQKICILQEKSWMWMQ